MSSIIPLNNINRLVFVTEVQCIFCPVGSVSFNYYWSILKG
jgi:hypothetical protein